MSEGPEGLYVLVTIRDQSGQSLTKSLRLGATSQNTAAQDCRSERSCSSDEGDERASSVGSEASLLPKTESSPNGSWAEKLIRKLVANEEPGSSAPKMYKITLEELRTFLLMKDLDPTCRAAEVLQKETSRFSVTQELSRKSTTYSCSSPTDLNSALKSITNAINQANGARARFSLHPIPPERTADYAAYIINKRHLSWKIVAQRESLDQMSEGVEQRVCVDRGLVPPKEPSSLWDTIKNRMT